MTERGKNLLALAVGVIVSWMIAEVFLSLFFSQDIRVMGDKIRLRANYEMEIVNHGMPGVEDVIHHAKNSLGFRGPNPPAEDFDKKFKILTIGGSTTETYYISDGETWPDLVADELNAAFNNSIWLNNAGLDGHSTFGHRILLEDYVLQQIQPQLQGEKPDLALFFIGANDVGRKDLRDRLVINPTFEHDDFSWGVWLKAQLNKIADHSEVVSVTMNLLRNMRHRGAGLAHDHVDLTKLPQEDKPLDEKIVAEQLQRHAPFHRDYQKRVVELIELSRANGIEPVMMTQPALFGCGVDPVTGVDLATLKQGPIDGCLKWRILDGYNDVVRRVGKQHHVLVIDLAQQLPHSSGVFYDWYHFNREGSRQVAQIVTRQLQPLVGRLMARRQSEKP
ncbi:SGNH/GDSL hydrolase family protein [Magnetofaba australis]|uniref:Putative lysophospholipase L1-like esterase n=1 Tax=Magnetofaba australis IT-1 TaxID=1434232 RepID=A0A1Y2K028_9PROT|nr:SGNH/GDSL hydrolase family protein [Magnetofaba australis]OSM00093.1 putative lysophospholipase L1-like esterase [Magnetofaba australis IT-1]